MELLIKARNLEINERTRTYIQKRFTPLGRRLRGIGETKVEMRREPTHSPQERVIVQVTVNVNGTLLRAEERGASVTAVVDAVAKALDRQVLKYKGRHYRSSTRKRRGQIRSIRSQESPVGATAEEEEEPKATVLSTGKVVRVKQFPIQAMPVEEAALQMDLLGHHFFLFLNGATQQYNVLYRRNDGDYGILEPKLE